MLFIKSEKYDKQFVNENLMGPNSLKIIEELTSEIDLKPGMRIMDLGCGKGLTSIFLAKEFGVNVFAVDLWIDASENYRRFRETGLDNLIIPIHSDVNEMPFANDYFDAVISVDSYHYYGGKEKFIDNKIAPYVKKNGIVVLAFPEFKKDIHDSIPPEFLLSWKAEDLETFHSCQWWDDILQKSEDIEIKNINEMSCFQESWNDWLNTNNKYAVNDRKSMEAGAGRYMNLISVNALKR